MEEFLDNIYDNILDGNAEAVPNQVLAALEAGIPAEKVLREGMIAAMTEVGCQFEEGEAFVPEMLIAARAMKAGLAVLRPHLIAADVVPAGKVVLGTVSGDMHDIGKNLVGMMLEGAGFEILDLGVDVSADTFVQAVQEAGDIDVVALSALLTTTMPQMGTVVEAFMRAEIYGDVKIIVGGAPVTSEFAEAIGAHGYAQDASQAVAVVKSFAGMTS